MYKEIPGMQCLDYPLLHQDALPGFFWGGLGKTPDARQKGKNA